jgi:uncharacterized Zn-finger protein
MDQITGGVNNGRGGSVSGSGGNNLNDSTDRDPVTNKYSCGRCGRSYLHQATLVRHQRYECGIQASYPCEYCNRKFKRRDVLKGHKEKCVNKVQAQAALVSAANLSGGSSTPGTVSPPSMVIGDSSPPVFRPELHPGFQSHID